MRILSQDGMIDMSYEQMIINIDYTNKNQIVACGVSCDGENSIFHIAEYSTAEKAQKAMEMLRKAYSPLLIIKDLGNGVEADIKPNDWIISRTEPNGIRENFYFQFPADDEIEV